MTPQNSINWFEIPVKDFARAQKFYSAILGSEVLPAENMPGVKMGFLPAQKGGITGAIIAGEGYEPSDKGALVYLNAERGINVILKDVEAAGGKVVLPETNIGQYGKIARFRDTEGNLVALHTGN